MGPSVLVSSQDKESFFYVPSHSDYADLKKALVEDGIVADIRTFDLLAKKMNLQSHVYPGKYVLLFAHQIVKERKRGRGGFNHS